MISGYDDPYPIAEQELVLKQNYPNPFSTSTQIPFELKNPGMVYITVYDLLGNNICLLTAEKYLRGKYTVSWNGTDSNGNIVPGGIYFYQIKTRDYLLTKKMNFIK